MVAVCERTVYVVIEYCNAVPRFNIQDKENEWFGFGDVAFQFAVAIWLSEVLSYI